MANILPTTKQILNDNFNALNNSLIKKTVGYQSGMDYYIATGATNADVAINAAIAAVSAAGGGTVELGYGTFTISEPIQIRSNVRLIGQGCGSSYWDFSTSPSTWVDVPGNTTVKAKTNYAPTVLNHNGGYSLLLSYNNAATYNTEIAGITWDNNAQNWGTPSVGVASARHRAIWPKYSYHMVFRDNEVINPWNWACYFHFGDDIKILRNRIMGGWDSNDGTKYTGGRQDGIDIKATNFIVCSNIIDTYGIATSTTESSGDDAIVTRQDGVSEENDPASKRGIICHNIIRSGSRGIVHEFVGGNTYNFKVHDNIIQIATASGILVHRISGTATIIDSDIHNNTVVKAGAGPGTSATAGGIVVGDEGTPGVVGSVFQGLSITNNRVLETQQTTGTYAGYGIVINAGGDDIDISGNKVDSVAGNRAISLGTGSYQVTNFKINSNIVFQRRPSLHGIGVDGARYGTVSGNVITGGSAGSGSGVRIISNGAASTVSTDVAVTGNQIRQFGAGIAEVNNGIAPNYNIFSGNIISSVTSAITTVGANTYSSTASGAPLNLTHN